ncbi:hypothetical protein PS862_02342 [Pseudomonas fluorescens]|uniref:Uncharacterized protein n=1 Tax=Pseudomonas fluorescens TaxID=294 RepID=A0A5E6TXN2_PSEFL|nr:hypothetical protein PS639_02919 [Pseudomonas fluorescens]VVO91112.1 hypothetical protein PS862_02342 [Pseudomonas fluorescens]
MTLFVGASGAAIRLSGEGSLEGAFAGKSDRRTAGSYGADFQPRLAR